MILRAILSQLLLLLTCVSAFTSYPRHAVPSELRRSHPSAASPSSLPAVFPAAVSSYATDGWLSHMPATSSVLLSTVDADIAKLSDNEFAPIFAGGILVMFGGLLSAVIVGTIVNKRNLYASIVAESYAQGPDDEEFWKGLSEEEKKKAEELLRKVRANNKGERIEDRALETPPTLASTEGPRAPASVTQAPTTQNRPSETKDVDMFSDY